MNPDLPPAARDAIREAAQQLAESWPPLTSEQQTRMRVLLRHPETSAPRRGAAA